MATMHILLTTILPLGAIAMAVITLIIFSITGADPPLTPDQQKLLDEVLTAPFNHREAYGQFDVEFDATTVRQKSRGLNRWYRMDGETYVQMRRFEGELELDNMELWLTKKDAVITYSGAGSGARVYIFRAPNAKGILDHRLFMKEHQFPFGPIAIESWIRDWAKLDQIRDEDRPKIIPGLNLPLRTKLNVTLTPSSLTVSLLDAPKGSIKYAWDKGIPKWKPEADRRKQGLLETGSSSFELSHDFLANQVFEKVALESATQFIPPRLPEKGKKR